MTIKRYNLWHGYLPLIQDVGTKYPNDERAAFRVASSTMTQGATPACIESREQAERLAAIHAQDGETLTIQPVEITV